MHFPIILHFTTTEESIEKRIKRQNEQISCKHQKNRHFSILNNRKNENVILFILF